MFDRKAVLLLLLCNAVAVLMAWLLLAYPGIAPHAAGCDCSDFELALEVVMSGWQALDYAAIGAGCVLVALGEFAHPVVRTFTRGFGAFILACGTHHGLKGVQLYTPAVVGTMLVMGILECNTATAVVIHGARNWRLVREVLSHESINDALDRVQRIDELEDLARS